MSDPNPYNSTVINVRPSKIDALKSAVSGTPGTLTAILVAITGIVGVVQTYQSTQSTLRSSYETLKVAVEKNATEIAVCRQEQLNSQAWIEDNFVRFEKKQDTTDKLVNRKVTRTAAPPPPPPITEPAPKPPVAAVLPERTALPAFEAL